MSLPSCFAAYGVGFRRRDAERGFHTCTQGSDQNLRTAWASFNKGAVGASSAFDGLHGEGLGV